MSVVVAAGAEAQSRSDGNIALRQRSQDLEAWPAEQRQYSGDAHYISPLKLPGGVPSPLLTVVVTLQYYAN